MRKAIIKVIKGQYFFPKMHENMHILCLCVYARGCVWSKKVHVNFLTHLEYPQLSGPVGKTDSIRFI